MFGLSKFRRCNLGHRLLIRSVSNLTNPIPNAEPKFKMTFDEMMKHRKQEADRSLVIQVSSEKSYQELLNYCSQFGAIRTAVHYKIPAEGNNNFILLEYEELTGCQKALLGCRFDAEISNAPVASPFLWFKIANGPLNKLKSSESFTEPNLKLKDNRLLKDEELFKMLQTAKSFEDQIVMLHRATCLDDLGTRMRFLAARQLETSIQGMFPNANAYPFGSSVNGFGKMGCDLDLILKFHNGQNEQQDSRLIFHTKGSAANIRSQMQRHMETLGDILHLFLPGVSDVRRILQARVPIIKYNHECLDLEVDLSLGNMTGLYMSEMLYLFGELDDRVRPLTFCIRKWASVSGITNPSPGRWISNFSLTLLVIFFLQNLKKPILPSLAYLVKSARKEDIRITDDVNCTFLRDLRHLQFQRSNESNLSYLLCQFFEFYSQFDFKTASISINQGKSVLKIDHSAMYIINPLESELNVSKNVSHEEVERFQHEVKSAAWILESSSEKPNEMVWGLLSILNTNKQAVMKSKTFKSRIVNVQDLFKQHDGQSENIDFKNESTRKEVNTIRESTKRLIKKRQKLERTKLS